MSIIIDGERGLLGEAEMEALEKSGLLGNESLAQRAAPEYQEVDVEIYSVDLGDDFYPTPIEPEDGIIAIPIGAKGLPADEEEGIEPEDEEKKIKVLGEIKAAFRSLVSALTSRHYGPGRHPGTGTPQSVHAGDGAASTGERDVSRYGAKLDEKEVGSSAEKKYSEAENWEPNITPILRRIAAANQGEMAGLEHRLKKIEALMNKIMDDAQEKGVSPEEAARQINDNLRYTIIFPPDRFVEEVEDVQEELGQAGYVQFDNKWKNFFAPGDDYDGYNTVMIDPKTGIKFELQYHTPESIEIKDECHDLYDLYQEAPAGSLERKRLYDQMIQLWDGTYERPEGWERLPGIRK